MPVEPFTISINGAAAVTLGSLGVTDATLTLNNTGANSKADDALKLTINAAPETAPFLAENDKVELFSDTGAGLVRRYVGWAPDRVDYPISTTSERQRYKTESPNRYLRSSYEQIWYDTSGTGVWSGRIRLTWQATRTVDTTTIVTLNMRQQLEAVLAYAKLYGNGGGAAPFDYDVTGFPELRMPEREMQSPSALDVIEEVLKFCPGVGLYWDYSGSGNPCLRCVNVTNFNAAGEFLNPPTLAGSGSPAIHTLANDGSLFTEFSPKAVGTKIRKLTVVWQAAESRIVDDVTNYVAAYSTESRTLNNGSIRDMSIHITLRGFVWDGETLTNPEQVPDTGLVDLLLQGYSRNWWEFDLTAKPGDFHWDKRPCDIVNVTGSAPAHASAHSSIQQIERELMAGTMSASTGAPTQRGINELTALKQTAMAFGGQEQASTDPTTQTYGREEDPRPDQGSSAAPDDDTPETVIYFMQNGVATSLKFHTAPL